MATLPGADDGAVAAMKHPNSLILDDEVPRTCCPRLRLVSIHYVRRYLR